MTPPEAALAATGIHFSYGARRLLTDVGLRLAYGEVVSLLGANGAGKSTLLRILLGFLAPSQGQVTLEGKPLVNITRRQMAQRMAYVPQVHSVHFPYRVSDIVLLGRFPHTGMTRGPNAQDHQAAERAMQRMGIVQLQDRPYTEISGGERQRVMIARALAQCARILVLDEPVTGLDYGNQIRLLQHLRQLADEGYAVLMTTHHPEHALRAADRIILLESGRISVDGATREVLTPEAVSKLYGIPVAALCDPQGRIAGFHPV